MCVDLSRFRKQMLIKHVLLQTYNHSYAKLESNTDNAIMALQAESWVNKENKEREADTKRKSTSDETPQANLEELASSKSEALFFF